MDAFFIAVFGGVGNCFAVGSGEGVAVVVDEVVVNFVAVAGAGVVGLVGHYQFVFLNGGLVGKAVASFVEVGGNLVVGGLKGGCGWDIVGLHAAGGHEGEGYEKNDINFFHFFIPDVCRAQLN